MKEYRTIIGAALGFITMIMVMLLCACDVIDTTDPVRVVAPPPVAPAIQQKENAVQFYFLDENGKPFTTHAQVQARLTANNDLSRKYSEALAAISVADKKLIGQDEVITEKTWANYFYIAGGIVLGIDLIYIVILAVEGGITSLLGFGILEKIAYGAVILGALLCTIGRYVHEFMYVPYVIAVGVVLAIAFVFVTHHGIGFLKTLKSVLQKGFIDAEHMANPIFAAVVKRAGTTALGKKIETKLGITGAPSGSV